MDLGFARSCVLGGLSERMVVEMCRSWSERDEFSGRGSDKSGGAFGRDLEHEMVHLLDRSLFGELNQIGRLGSEVGGMLQGTSKAVERVADMVCVRESFSGDGSYPNSVTAKKP